jgi:hypothetical protein
MLKGAEKNLRRTNTILMHENATSATPLKMTFMKVDFRISCSAHAQL